MAGRFTVEGFIVSIHEAGTRKALDDLGEILRDFLEVGIVPEADRACLREEFRFAKARLRAGLRPIWAE